MQSYAWLIKPKEIFKNSRYVLWLTPDSNTTRGTITERKIDSLREALEKKLKSVDKKIDSLVYAQKKQQQ